MSVTPPHTRPADQLASPSRNSRRRIGILSIDRDSSRTSQGNGFLSFTPPSFPISVNMKPRGLKQKEADSTHAEINESRKLAVQACIVRVMKARKTMQHAQLISEVVTQLKDRFKVQIPLIKKSIDVLIEKEYLERDEKERGKYMYVA